jgi:hypothetical protein
MIAEMRGSLACLAGGETQLPRMQQRNFFFFCAFVFPFDSLIDQ